MHYLDAKHLSWEKNCPASADGSVKESNAHGFCFPKGHCREISVESNGTSVESILTDSGKIMEFGFQAYRLGVKTEVFS